MSDGNFIGHGRCPCCGNGKARFTHSKKLLAVVTCNACNFQGFARSDASDEHLRKNITARAGVAPAVQDPPAAEPVRPPAQVEPVEPVRTETPAKKGFGLMSWS